MRIDLQQARFWATPELTSLGRLPMRATLYPYPDSASALKNDRESTPLLQFLNGTWDFSYHATPDEALEVIGGGLEGVSWAPITVPGNWQMQGYGRPHYTNVMMPFPDLPPFVPEDNPTGIYRRGFTVAPEWAGKRVVLHFGSANCVLALWVNGRFMGISKDSCLPAEFDVTEVIRGNGAANEIVAMVIQWSDASHIEDQDQWWLSGLQREVYVYATAPVFIGQVQARPTWDVERSLAKLQVFVDEGYVGRAASDADVELELFDAQGASVWKTAAPVHIEQWLKGGTWPSGFRAEVTAEIPGLSPWSAETPVLYTLVVKLSSQAGTEYTSTRIGFKTVTVGNRELLVNGRRIQINGVNRHDHHDKLGKAIPRETMRQDALVMKAFNVNAVRTSHYPNDPYFLEVCDELGLYVIDEANIEAHHHNRTICRDPRYRAAMLDRVGRMVERDLNHACIIGWSLGNESNYGPNHDAAAGWVRHLDPTRFLHYESVLWGESEIPLMRKGLATDVVCPMYTSPNQIRVWAAHEDDRPLIMCEYNHAMGNSNGGLVDYFDVFENVPGCQGGFIWEWIDHGIKQTNEAGEEYWAYGGDFGDVPNDANFVCDGFVWPDRQAHPGFYEFKKLAQPVRVKAVEGSRTKFEIENRNFFTDISGLVGQWTLLVDGEPEMGGVVADFKPGPRQKEVIEIPELAEAPAEGEVSVLFRFTTTEDQPWAEAGHEAAFDQIILSQEAAPGSLWEELSHAAPAAVQGQSVTLGDWSVALAEDGVSSTLAYNGVTVLEKLPMANVWRAPTDNDGIKLWSGQGSKPLGRWRSLGLDKFAHRLVKSQALEHGGQTTGWQWKFAGTGRDKWEDLNWDLSLENLTSGGLKLSAEFQLGPDMVDLPRVGVFMELAAGYDLLRWMGYGPLENYPDRMQAAYLAVHESTVADQYVPYIMPQEHGLKCGAHWLELANENHAVPPLWIAGTEPFAFSALHHSVEQITGAFHTPDLKPQAKTFLSIDAAHRGLGTASCGPDTFEHYRIKGDTFRLELLLEVI